MPIAIFEMTSKHKKGMQQMKKIRNEKNAEAFASKLADVTYVLSQHGNINKKERTIVASASKKLKKSMKGITEKDKENEEIKKYTKMFKNMEGMKRVITILTNMNEEKRKGVIAKITKRVNENHRREKKLYNERQSKLSSRSRTAMAV